MTDRLAESKTYRTSRAGTLEIDNAQASSEPEAVRRRFCALDEASYHLDSVSEPWSVHLEVRLSGTVDEDRLRQAVGVALARHSRARARVTIAHHRRADYEWEVTPAPDVDPLDVVMCPDDEALQTVRADLQSLSVPLGTSPPLRIRLARHCRGDVVMLNVHHAAGDGIAALRLLRSIVRAYAARCDPVSHTPPEEMQVPAPSGRKVRLRALVGELRQAASRSVHLVPSGGEDRPGYRLHHLVLDTAQTAALATKADAGTTVNDLLLASLHLALDSWNTEHGGTPGRLSVLMPVNLRPKSRWYEVFGNFTFMVPVVTRPEDRSNPTATVETIHRRTQRIKDERTPTAVVRLLDVLQHLPLRAKRALPASPLPSGSSPQPSCPTSAASMRTWTSDPSCAPARCGSPHRPGCPWAWPSGRSPQETGSIWCSATDIHYSARLTSPASPTAT